ncbi:MAG: hypothetical protein K6F99_09145 [Lachnospiraceae bacterium]|nr:hypothetical protein [Lachnospiraceae bacterium]
MGKLKDKLIDKSNMIALSLALVHSIITSLLYGKVFTVEPFSQPVNFIICRIAAFVILFLIYRALVIHNENTVGILKYALIYFIPIIAVLIFKLPQGFLSNDERLIFEQATALADYTWFYYLTTYYYIITMMIIPGWLGPVLMKVLLQVLFAGYTVFRTSKLFGKKYGVFMYLVFLLPPVLAYTTSAHRIPVYFLLYAFTMFSMLMDRLQEVKSTGIKVVWLLFLGAILTQWRTEGIYLAVILPILMFVCYPDLRNKKSIIRVVLISLLLQYLVQIPQNGALPVRMGDKADNRMGPFYAYTITNMFGNGLDEDKNAEAIAEVDRYLDVSEIKRINAELGEINYEDVLILYYEGFKGRRENATDEDYRAYLHGCQTIFKNNPDVFIKTRIGAFHYAATPYNIEWKEGGITGFAKFVISIIKTIAYNLYVPHLILFCMFIYSLIKRRAWGFFFTGGLICHFLIVFILAPASYFKYYFPVYFMMYFMLDLIIIKTVYARNNKDSSKPVTEVL